MSNIIDDIVNDYQEKMQKGINEIYYKADLTEGAKLLIGLIGIGKILLALGMLAGSAITTILSWANRNPQIAANCAKILIKNRKELVELINSIGSRFNDAYNELSEQNKKRVRTVILLIAKNGLSWEQLK